MGCVKSGSPAAVNSNAAPKPADGSKIYAFRIQAAPVMLPGLIVPATGRASTVFVPIVPEPPRKAPPAMLNATVYDQHAARNRRRPCVQIHTRKCQRSQDAFVEADRAYAVLDHAGECAVAGGVYRQDG